MRLGVLERGQHWQQRVALWVLRFVSRTEPDPMAQVSLHRPELFGRPWAPFMESVMRGPSEWSAAERELMAAFVSRLNVCSFCVGVHDGTSTLLLGNTRLVDRLDDWRAAGFTPRITAIFELLEKVTLAPDSVLPADIEPVRAAGVSDTAITDALYVGFVFNTINRLANALDFRWDSEVGRMRLAASLNRIRYHLPEFLLR